VPRRLPAIALGLFLLVAAPLALASSSANQDIPFSPVGRDQKVAVVSCLYKGDKLQSYDVSAETWARVLDDKLNKYFVEASDGEVTFDFVPIPSFCIFDEKYSETTPPALLGSGFDIEDDPLTIVREAGQAILYADGKIPGRSTWGGTDINRLLVIVNRPKRGRATMPPGLVYETGSSGPKNITVSVISSVQDPVRANGSSTTPGKRGTTEGILNDEDIALVAHELGHQLGLPDLYNDEDGGREHTELWDPMGFQTLQEFSAFSRYLPGWLGEYRTRIVERGTPPEGVEVTLVPRGGPSPRGATDAVLIPTTGPFLRSRGASPTSRPSTGTSSRRAPTRSWMPHASPSGRTESPGRQADGATPTGCPRSTRRASSSPRPVARPRPCCRSTRSPSSALGRSAAPAPATRPGSSTTPSWPRPPTRSARPSATPTPASA
jgi:hypothetical protein